MITILIQYYEYPMQILYLYISKLLLHILQYYTNSLQTILQYFPFVCVPCLSLLIAYSLLSLQCISTQLTPVPCVNSDYYPQYGDHTAMVYTLLTPQAGRVCATQLLPDWL